MFSFNLIILIDDDPINNLINKRLINKMNLSPLVIEFLEAEKALGYIGASNDNQKTLILLDINMPVMNGWEFLEKFKEKSLDTDIYVVLVSSSTYRDDKQKAFRSDKVIDYVTKPLGVSDVEKIKNLKEIKSYFN